jgi:hypothetical protein
MFARTGRKSVQQALNRANRAFGTYKTSTGLVGLAVDPHGRENLIAVADEIMSSISRVPAGNQYRVNVEKWFSYMKKVANDTSDIRKIEDEIAVGQIEEILSMAKDELELIDMYVENRAWEMVAEEQVRADMVIDKMSDTIYFSNPAPPAEEIEGGQEKK